jgi:predicted dehydrogenase
MGPYYMTALVNLLGPVKRVTGSATITFPERTITSQPKNGTVMKVTCPTHVAGVMEFASGAIGTLMMSFDVWAARVPCIEIYGTEGSLAVPDPNGFGGPVTVWRKSTGIWADVRHTHGYADNNRGIGVADMCYAMRSGRPHRASGDLAFHVLDTMVTIYDAWDAGKWVDVASTCERPAALPLNLKPGTLDE